MRIEELTEVYTEEELLDFEELSQEEQDKIFDATLKKIEGANMGKQKRKIIDIFKSFSVAKKIAAAVIIGLVFMGTTALAVEIAQNIRLSVKTENVVNENSLGIRYDINNSTLYFWSPNMPMEEVERKIGIQEGTIAVDKNLKEADEEQLKKIIEENRKKLAESSGKEGDASKGSYGKSTVSTSERLGGIEEAREYLSVPIIIGDYLEENYEIYEVSKLGNSISIEFWTKLRHKVSIRIDEHKYVEGSRWFSTKSMDNEKLSQSENMQTASGETVSVFIGEIRKKIYAYIVDEYFIYEIVINDLNKVNTDYDAMLEEIEKIVSSMDLTEDIE